MRDVLPDFVMNVIRDRYLAGVADAEAKFEYGKDDEDSLTGALGQAITMLPRQLRVGDEEYEVKIYYRKIRGRGPGAPEGPLGADGIFQIEVSKPRENLFRRKGLPFQAKKGWKGTNRGLLGQSRSMLHSAGDGLVIDYARNGYSACRASAVVEAHGNRKVVERFGAMRSLGQLLGNEFLECTIGVPGLFFDPEEGVFTQETADDSSPLHAITTVVAATT